MKTNQGFIKNILIVIIAIVLAKYLLHFDFIAWLRTTQARHIIDPIILIIKAVYNWIDNFVRNLVS
ncbi:hypothetical protein H0W91_01470 [Patescibacteria group bacterium]|nr:hypothetical protein [Patescibacteria group bacterium]